MNVFRKKTREEKLVEYLVGEGLFSTLPETLEDAFFYRLAGKCAHSTWPIKPGGKPLDVVNAGVRQATGSENEDSIRNSCQGLNRMPDCSQPVSRGMKSTNSVPNVGVNALPAEGDTTLSVPNHSSCSGKEGLMALDINTSSMYSSDDDCQQLFVPRPTLPYPLYQDTYRKWKAAWIWASASVISVDCRAPSLSSL